MKTSPTVWLAPAAALAAALAAAPLPAQVPSLNSSAGPAKEGPSPDPFGRNTPSSTVSAFVDAIAEEDYERASRFLDLADIPAARRSKIGAAMAEQLQQQLDAGGKFLPRPRIADAPEGRLVDRLRPDLEKVGTLALRKADAPILLERKASASGDHYWVISDETLDVALSARRSAAPPLAERWLPPFLSRWDAAGAPLSHWLTLFAVTAAAFIFAWILLRSAVLAACRFGRPAGRTRDFIQAVSPPLALLSAVTTGGLSAPALGISIVARQTMGWWFEIVGWVALGWLAWRIVDASAARILDRLSHKGRLNATSIIRFAGRLAKILLLAITLMAILDTLGFNVTAAVAALGIGGIAIALGAQKTVENLIASISILSDRPFRIGEVCRFGSTVGTVEDIGMRSSRIRTLDRTLLTIPNSNLSNAEIENFSRRDRGGSTRCCTCRPRSRARRSRHSLPDCAARLPTIGWKMARLASGCSLQRPTACRSRSTATS